MEPLSQISTLKKTLPTSRHAEMLFDSVLAQLGDEAAVVSCGEGRERTIYRRESAGSPWIVPWPLLELTLGRRRGFVGVPGNFSDAVPEESRKSPSKLRNLQGGEITILAADGEFSWTYAGDGQVFETMRINDEVLVALVRAVENGRGNPIDRLVAVITDRDVAGEAPGRVRFPEDAAVAMTTAWTMGLRAMRRALFKAAPVSATWIAADGYAGKAIGQGATREDAVAACRREIERSRPCPPPPEPKPELSPELLEAAGFEPSEFQIISRPAEDRTRGAATPETTPIVLTRLEGIAVESDVGRPVVLLDRRGRSCDAVVCRKDDGLTIVGGAVIDRIDFDRLDEQIDAATTAWRNRHGPERPWPEALPPLRSRTWTLDLVADGSLRTESTGASPAFDEGLLDGARLTAAVLRQTSS